MNENALDPKAIIEALERRIVRLEDALYALLESRIDHGWYSEEDAERQGKTMQNFRQGIFKERGGE